MVKNNHCYQVAEVGVVVFDVMATELFCVVFVCDGGDVSKEVLVFSLPFHIINRKRQSFLYQMK